MALARVRASRRGSSSSCSHRVAAATGAAGCSSSSAAPPAGRGRDASARRRSTAPSARPATPRGSCAAPRSPAASRTVTIHCTCIDGAFQCVDGSGNPFSAGETPSCGDAAGNLPSCPATEAAANGATCSAAQSGQQCAYPPKCAGGTLAYDLCTCESDSGRQSGFTFDCQNSCAGGTGPVPRCRGPRRSGGHDASGDDASDGSSGDDAGPRTS